MKDRIIEMLGRDERVELECVDEEAMIASNKSYADVLLSMPLIVSHIFTNKIVFNNGLFIRENNLKYFKIKEPEYTFNDLIDVAVKAVKDGVLDGRSINLSDHLIGVNIDGRDYSWNKEEVYYGKLFFNTLYTETFVIESEEDIKRVKKGAAVTLANGNAFDVALSTQLGRGWVLDTRMNELGQHQTYCIFVLKGATVTQKRGA